MLPRLPLDDPRKCQHDRDKASNDQQWPDEANEQYRKRRPQPHYADGSEQADHLSATEAVRLLTDRPARLYGVRDRGRLAAGWWADVCVIDPETLASDPVGPRHDLPGDQWRLYAGATGYEHVLVNGVAVVESGRVTGQRAGTVLRSGRDTETVHARG